MSNFNARVGSCPNDFEVIMGTHTVGNLNENGQLLLETCDNFELCVRSTMFAHKIHKTNWLSPNGKTENQIDYFCVSQKWKKALTDFWKRKVGS